jgi:hypothetical protein
MLLMHRVSSYKTFSHAFAYQNSIKKIPKKRNFIEIYTTVPLVTHFFPFFVSSVDVLKLFTLLLIMRPNKPMCLSLASLSGLV